MGPTPPASCDLPEEVWSLRHLHPVHLGTQALSRSLRSPSVGLTCGDAVKGGEERKESLGVGSPGLLRPSQFCRGTDSGREASLGCRACWGALCSSGEHALSRVLPLFVVRVLADGTGCGERPAPTEWTCLLRKTPPSSGHRVTPRDTGPRSSVASPHCMMHV